MNKALRYVLQLNQTTLKSFTCILLIILTVNFSSELAVINMLAIVNNYIQLVENIYELHVCIN